MNIITTVGYLTADPVLSTTNSGQQACKFRLGSQNKRRDENNQFMSQFYNCTVWGKMGETIAKMFRKGSRIMVTGDLTIRDYVDKNQVSRVSVDIDVRDWDFGERSAGAPQTQQQPTPVPQQPQVQYQAPVYAAAPQVPQAPQAPQMMYQPQVYAAQPQPPMINPNDPAVDALPF